MNKKKIRLLIEMNDRFSERNFHVYYDSIASFGDWNKEIIIGQKQVCRFCGETDSKYFKQNTSHTFPEFTGNKWLFSNDECKNCNSLFSTYENALADYGHLLRSILAIKGKKGLPTFKTKNEKIRIKSDGKTAEMNIGYNFKDAGDDRKLQEEIGIDFHDLKNQKTIYLNMKQHPFVPLYLYKSLAKIAFSIMPENEFSNGEFKEFTKWILNRDFNFSDDNIEPYFHFYHNTLPLRKREPILMLFKKRTQFHGLDMPAFAFFFGYGSHVFQIFLPYYNGDNFFLKKAQWDLPIIPSLVINEGGKCKIIKMNGTSVKKAQPSDLTFRVTRNPE